MADTRFERVMRLCEIDDSSPKFSAALAQASGTDMDDVFRKLLNLMKRNAEGVPGTAEFERSRDQQLLRLAHQMVRAKRSEEAGFLMDLISDPDTNRESYLETRLNLMELTGDSDGELAVMQEIRALPEIPSKLFAAYKRRNSIYKLSDKFELFEKRWGVTPDAGMDGLRDVVESQDRSELDEDLLKWAWSVSETGIDDFEEYARRAQWGHLAPEYYTDLIMTAYEIRVEALKDELNKKEEIDWAENKLKELYSILSIKSENEIIREFELDRSLVFCVSHFGIIGAVEYWLGMNNLSYSRIGVGSDDEHTVTENLDPRTNPGPRLLKLARSAKAKPMAIGMAPDGQIGDRMAELPFLGRRVTIGQGGPTLTYLSNAKSMFLTAVWGRNGAGIEIYHRVGPTAVEGVDRDEFFAEWNEFYLGCLKEIVLGPPENLHFRGGIWKNLK